MKRIIAFALCILTLLALSSCAIYRDPERHSHTGVWNQTANTHVYTYTCGCELADIVGTHEDGGYGFCIICGFPMNKQPSKNFLRSQSGAEWISEISAAMIAEVRFTESRATGIKGGLKYIYTSTDREIISEFFEELYWLEVTPREDYSLTYGSTWQTVCLTLTDGSEKQIGFGSGFFHGSDGVHYELLYTPTLEGDEVELTYGIYTNSNVGRVCTVDPETEEKTEILQINLTQLEFEYRIEIDEGELTPYDKAIVTDVGELYFLSPTVFIFEGDYGRLIGTDLERIIAENS